MFHREALRSSIEALRANKFRAFLTALGLVIFFALSILYALLDSLRTAIHKANPALSAAKLHSAETAAVVLAIILGLIGLICLIILAIHAAQPGGIGSVF